MKVGVLGTGDVGRSLGTAFVTLGHEVKIGSRTARNEPLCMVWLMYALRTGQWNHAFEMLRK